LRLMERVYLAGGGAYGYSAEGDCNIYLVDGGEALALIDTGGGNGIPKVVDNIRRMGLDPGMLEVAFLTHCHFDHIGGNHDLKRAVDVKFVAHESEVEHIENLDELSLCDMARERGLAFSPEKVDLIIRDGDALKVGEVDFEVFHTPGHTPGCISLLIREGERTSFFTGDIASSQGRLGYINGPGFDLDDWKRSIKRLIELGPDKMYPGHNTFVLSGATDHLKLLDQKMNAPWINIVTSIG
jgi:hydroxyacylglutathione hydrolase